MIAILVMVAIIMIGCFTIVNNFVATTDYKTDKAYASIPEGSILLADVLFTKHFDKDELKKGIGFDVTPLLDDIFALYPEADGIGDMEIKYKKITFFLLGMIPQDKGYDVDIKGKVFKLRDNQESSIASNYSYSVFDNGDITRIVIQGYVMKGENILINLK